MSTFTFKRGAPVTVQLRVDDAGNYDPAELVVTAKIKAALGNGSAPPPSMPAVAEMGVAFTPAATPDPAFWTLTPSGPLACGLYIADAEIRLGGDVLQVTDPIVLSIAESVTPA
jgi:hypothetical protein